MNKIFLYQTVRVFEDTRKTFEIYLEKELELPIVPTVGLQIGPLLDPIQKVVFNETTEGADFRCYLEPKEVLLKNLSFTDFLDWNLDEADIFEFTKTHLSKERKSEFLNMLEV